MSNRQMSFTADNIAAGARLLAESNASVARREVAKAEANERQRVEIAAKERAAYLETPAGKAELAANRAEAERIAYANAVLSLPEAHDRPRTARQIVEAHTSHSMPVHRAKLWLAGLPREPQSEQTHTTTKGHDTMTDRTLRRRAEIRHSSLAFKADQGDEAARKEANAIGYALKLNDAGTEMNSALKMAGANLAAFSN